MRSGFPSAIGGNRIIRLHADSSPERRDHPFRNVLTNGSGGGLFSAQGGDNSSSRATVARKEKAARPALWRRVFLALENLNQ